MNVFLAGDSTMSYYPKERFPRTGWGQVFQDYFNDDVMVINEGASGRSTRTFIEEERLNKIDGQIRVGDYLFIQFGHNDAKVNSERYTEPHTTYKQNLTKFVEVAWKRQAYPVLVTPVQRRNFNADGTVLDSHDQYAVAIRELAEELDVPLLDITKSSTVLLEEIGDENSKKLFMWIEPNQYEYYPEGEKDNTHFSLEGAKEIARLVIEAIKQKQLPLCHYLKKVWDKQQLPTFTVSNPDIPSKQFDITEFGAIGNGIHNNTEAFKKTIEACTKAGGGKVVVPAGIWLTGPIRLQSKINLHVKSGALVRFTGNFNDYPLIISSFEGKETVRCQSPIDGEGLEDIAITGKGIFDGAGDYWRPIKKWKMTALQWTELITTGGVVDEHEQIWWPTENAMKGASVVDALAEKTNIEIDDYLPARDYLRPNLVSLRKCTRVVLDGPTFQNSPAWNVHPWLCEHVKIKNIKVRNPWYAQNGDGLDLESCRYAIVSRCEFDVGDDAICIKSGKDEAGRKLAVPSQDILIEKCTVFNGHGGFVIGSEMSGDVRNIQIADCVFSGTDKGIRLKTARGRGGSIENIVIENIKMLDISKEAVIIQMYYESEQVGAAQPVTEKTPVIRNIWLEKIDCYDAQAAIVLKGLPESPLTGITCKEMTLTSKEGITCLHTSSLLLDSFEGNIAQAPLIQLDNCDHFHIRKFRNNNKVKTFIKVTGKDTKAIDCSGLLNMERLIEIGREVDVGQIVISNS
ncbi:glycosyl hydrolase family 28 protein [Paraliobacillus sediminis]|uniref:glycosyl hydrolase family 28 protein n=1 Tax=Paraliobacillus sediminis TaxID=1885916 RepID=UPI0013C33994|nr:glycosyl hydrolase family 28 protein [Paraliobacillus sediminis]